MFDWFRRRRPQPGNSPIEPSAPNSPTRGAVYRRFFGEPESIFQEPATVTPSIDVHAYRRHCHDGRPFLTLVTSGMSDLEMHVPTRSKGPRRAELIFYCEEPRPEYVESLRWLAHFPHAEKTWIGAGHTVPHGNPPAPFSGNAALNTILFLPPILKRDLMLPEELRLGGESVHFLWVVPLSEAESDLKVALGMDAIFEIFERHRHPHIFDGSRKSYV